MLHLWHVLSFVILQNAEYGTGVIVIKSDQGCESGSCIDGEKKVWEMAQFGEPELGGI